MTHFASGSDGTEYVLFFSKESVFSNHYPARIKNKTHGADYPTSEHYYMFEKAMFFGDFATAQLILSASSPGYAKKISNTIVGFNQSRWNSVSQKVMEHVVREKFSQNPRLKKELMATGSRIVVECNPADRRWGIGLSWDSEDATNPPKWRGTNWLGEIIMRVRSRFRQADKKLAEAIEKEKNEEAREEEEKKKKKKKKKEGEAAAVAEENDREEEENSTDSVSKDDANKVSAGSTDEDAMELDYGEEDETGEDEAEKKKEEKTEVEGEDEAMEISSPEPSDEVAAAVARSSSHPPSAVVDMRCLARPFTLPQLRAEISKHGTIKEDRFWIDSLKSHCIFEMESADQATSVCGSLHGQHWPAANPKTLSVNYSTKEDLDASLTGKPLPDRDPREGREREVRGGGGMAAAAIRAANSMREKERETHATPTAPRESRKDSTEDKRVVGTDSKENLKVTLERGRDDFECNRVEDSEREKEQQEEDKKDTSDRKRRLNESSPPRPTKASKEARREEEEPAPKKMASDYFKITKTLPAIYYLPLSEEEAEKRAAERKKKSKKRRKSKSPSRSVDRRRKTSSSKR